MTLRQQRLPQLVCVVGSGVLGLLTFYGTALLLGLVFLALGIDGRAFADRLTLPWPWLDRMINVLGLFAGVYYLGRPHYRRCQRFWHLHREE